MKNTMETVVDLDVDLSEDDMQRMLCHINQLDEIRAVQLDRMRKGAKISSVAGSSVGAVGGVLSIIGLALIPVTAGLSLALTVTGIGMGITSGVNSIVTTLCLEEATSQPITDVETSEKNVAEEAVKVLCKVGSIGKKIDSAVNAASAFQMLKSENLVASAGQVVAQEANALRNVPRVASDIPDIGQAAVKGSLALTKSARAGLIALNALFIGMDIDSISLAKGSDTEVSQFIRARAALWSSEMDSWQKIHDSLSEGLLTSEKKQGVLETPFYVMMEKKKQIETETEMEIPSDEMVSWRHHFI
uniref:Uncharacterized protein n=1 Tax=Monopterus albus TaxID=43700 RepID=A0A3Q3IJD8_MONAL